MANKVLFNGGNHTFGLVFKAQPLEGDRSKSVALAGDVCF